MQMGKTMEEKAFREHVSWVMFLLSILVIWAHSYNAELFSGGAPVTEGIWLTVHRIQDFLSAALGLTAVPGFFMLSAYLFFRSFSWEKLPAKWKSRVRSVAVPYLAWNLFYYLGYVLATRIPAVHRLIGKPPVPFNGEELLAAVLHYQYAPVFWYLYQLMFLILLSPVLYWIIKKRPRGLVFLAAVMAAVHFHLDTMHPNTAALLYYSFGIFMAVFWRLSVSGGWGSPGQTFCGSSCSVFSFPYPYGFCLTVDGWERPGHGCARACFYTGSILSWCVFLIRPEPWCWDVCWMGRPWRS